MSRKTKRQWREQRDRLLSAVRAAHKNRRTRFADLTWDSFKSARLSDGRRYAWYWDGDTKRTVYRYQWIWIQAHGPIPEGFHVHHKNGNPTDDRLENLDLLPASEHLRLHTTDREQQRRMLAGRGLTPTGKPEWICQTCGTVFKAYPKHGIRKFCSKECHRLAPRSTT